MTCLALGRTLAHGEGLDPGGSGFSARDIDGAVSQRLVKVASILMVNVYIKCTLNVRKWKTLLRFLNPCGKCT